jgi:biopolymer transport protein ExbB/TolQ
MQVVSWSGLSHGGFAMIPLIVGSLLTWAVLLERILTYRRIQKRASTCHLQTINLLLRGDASGLRALLRESQDLPLCTLVEVAQDIKRGLWLLGTTANAAPFVGLFGTVVGILESFQRIAEQRCTQACT